MGYDAKDTLTQGREAVFKAFKTHAVQATFTENNVTGYDFVNHQVLSTGASVTVEGLTTFMYRAPTLNPAEHDQDLFVRTEEVNPSLYNAVTWSDRLFTVVDYEDNGYVVKFILKEVT